MFSNEIPNYSRTYLSLLLEYLRTNKITVEISGDRLVNFSPASKIANKVTKDIIRDILDLEKKEGNMIESGKFIDFFIPHDTNCSTVSGEDELWGALNQIHF